MAKPTTKPKSYSHAEAVDLWNILVLADPSRMSLTPFGYAVMGATGLRPGVSSFLGIAGRYLPDQDMGKRALLADWLEDFAMALRGEEES